MEQAKNLGVKDYPNPSGGCLLTDPRFAERLREHLKYEKKLTIEDVALLKVGRHFRVDTTKVIVGRNEKENNTLLAISKSKGKPYLEAADHNGPITLYMGEEKLDLIEKAAAITVRYSDAPKDASVRVIYKDRTKRSIEIEAIAIKDEELENLRI